MSSRFDRAALVDETALQVADREVDVPQEISNVGERMTGSVDAKPFGPTDPQADVTHEGKPQRIGRFHNCTSTGR
jgi:hypothetical protein